MNLLYLKSETLGVGDKELGKKLLLNFLTKLINKNTQIDAVFCVNSAAFLTTENEQAIELFKTLIEKGTIISTCGTCLDYYNLREELKVGEIGSMDLLIELILSADKVITP